MNHALKELPFGVGRLFLSALGCYHAAMTLEGRLALAREIATRTPPRFMVDNSRAERRRASFAKAKRLTEALAKPPKG
jgi:hypothetical protein